MPIGKGLQLQIHIQTQTQMQTPNGLDLTCYSHGGRDLDSPPRKLEPESMSLSAFFTPISTPHRSARRCCAKKNKMESLHLKRRYYREKLRTLQLRFKCMPFAPQRTLDFATHEALLRRLGLWDFVHVKLDREVRTDLVEQLVVNYSPRAPPSRRSWVNGERIGLGRAEMARPLRLRSKWHRVDDSDTSGGPVTVSSEEVVFLEELVSEWLVFHDKNWVPPTQASTFLRFIKEGRPEKVDWAGLIWLMVESELLKAPNLMHCYYASHLQCLLKCQKPALFNSEFEKIGLLEMKENGIKVEGLEEKEEVNALEGMEDKEVVNPLRGRLPDEFSAVELENGLIDLILGQNGDLKKAEVEGFVKVEVMAGVKIIGLDDFSAVELENGQTDMILGQNEIEEAAQMEGFVEGELKNGLIDLILGKNGDVKEAEVEGFVKVEVVAGVKASGLDDFSAVELENGQTDMILGQNENEEAAQMEGFVEGEVVAGVKINVLDECCGKELENREIDLGLLPCRREKEMKLADLVGVEEDDLDGKLCGWGDLYDAELENGQIDLSLAQGKYGKESRVEGFVRVVENVEMRMTCSDDACAMELENKEMPSSFGEPASGKNLGLNLAEEEDVINMNMGASGGLSGMEMENGQIVLRRSKIKNDFNEVIEGKNAMDLEYKLKGKGQWLLKGRNPVGGNLSEQCSMVQSTDAKNIHYVQPIHNVNDSAVESELGMEVLSKVGESSTHGRALKRKIHYKDDVFVEPFVSEINTHMDFCSSSVLENSLTREINHLHEVHDHCLSENQKWMRSDCSRDEKSSDFSFWLQEVQIWMSKAKMTFAGREQAWEEAEMNHGMLINKLKQQDKIIQHYQKTKNEEIQKKQGEINQLKQQAYLMDSVLKDYRKALTATRMKFSEYTESFQLTGKELHKDGTGGGALGVIELEKQLSECQRDEAQEFHD